MAACTEATEALDIPAAVKERVWAGNLLELIDA